MNRSIPPDKVNTHVSLIDNTNIGIALLAVVTEAFPVSREQTPEWTALSKDGGHVEVQISLNGVALPNPAKALSIVLDRELARINEMAAKRALEMVTESGLEGIRAEIGKIEEMMRQSQWAFRKLIQEKTGVEIEVDESYP